MLVVTRYRVPVADGRAFLEQARSALDVLSAQKGFLRGHVGRASDDPALWVVSTQWEGVGAYRRALSAYDVKVEATPLLSQALDEPTAFEVLERREVGVSSSQVSDRASDATTVALGEAAEARVPHDLD
jgi:hypothetical protein